MATDLSRGYCDTQVHLQGLEIIVVSKRKVIETLLSAMLAYLWNTSTLGWKRRNSMSSRTV